MSVGDILVFFVYDVYFFSRRPTEKVLYARSTGELISRPTTSLRRVVKMEPIDTDEGLQSPLNLRADAKSEKRASSPIVVSSSGSDDATPKAKPVKRRTGPPSGKQKTSHIPDDISVSIRPTPRN